MPYKDKNKAREYNTKYMREYRKKMEPEILRTIQKKYNDNIRVDDYSKIYYQNNKERIKETARKTRERNPLKYKVKYMTSLNFEKEKQCGICKSTKGLNFHHWIYKLPVEKKHFSTLCTSCHGVQHGKRRVI